jgi:hypothetical protein
MMTLLRTPIARWQAKPSPPPRVCVIVSAVSVATSSPNAHVTGSSPGWVTVSGRLVQADHRDLASLRSLAPTGQTLADDWYELRVCSPAEGTRVDR